MTTPLLASRAQIQKLDRSNLLGSVEALPQQIQAAYQQTQTLTLPPTYFQVKHILVSGMGGSALGAHVLQHLLRAQLPIPLTISSDYRLPAFVSPHSLVILSSYSGTTEETLASAAQAQQLNCPILVITTGGDLAALARRRNWPLLLLNPTHNPCQQPRMAIGYAISSLLSLLTKLGLLQFSETQVTQLVNYLTSLIPTLSPENHPNPASNLAYAAYDKHLILVAAEHLIGAAHVVNNQLNENAKVLTSEWPLPEFNHHYLEALSHPAATRENTLFLFFNSALYHPRLQQRVLLTKTLAVQKGYPAHVLLLTAPNSLLQVFETIQIGAFFAAYLAFLYGLDPSPIPAVDWFKQEMRQ